jgi:hypothetical protein
MRFGAAAVLVLAASCRSGPTPEEKANIAGWIDAYLKAEWRARETRTHASGEHPAALRERDVLEMKIVSASERADQGDAVRDAVVQAYLDLVARSELLKQEKNGLLVMGRAHTPAEQERLSAIDAEQQKLEFLKASAKELSAKTARR